MSASFTKYLEFVDENGNMIDGKIYVRVTTKNHKFIGDKDPAICIIIETPTKYYHKIFTGQEYDNFAKQFKVFDDPAIIYETFRLSYFKCLYFSEIKGYVLIAFNLPTILIDKLNDKRITKKSSPILRSFHMDTVNKLINI